MQGIISNRVCQRALLGDAYALTVREFDQAGSALAHYWLVQLLAGFRGFMRPGGRRLEHCHREQLKLACHGEALLNNGASSCVHLGRWFGDGAPRGRWPPGRVVPDRGLVMQSLALSSEALETNKADLAQHRPKSP